MKTPPLNLGRRIIAQDKPCFLVAEMSGNHLQDISRAYQIIDMAASAKVDAIKLQVYTPDTMTINSSKRWFKIGKGGPWSGQNLYTLYKQAYTPWDWIPKLISYAEEKKLILFASVFDESSVDFLERFNQPVYKIASFENTDTGLLKRVGKTKKPVILSRGLASVDDINLALKTLKNAGCPAVAVLHCISAYPAPIEDMNVATVADIPKRFGVISGLSDHSLNTVAAISAVALGGKIIEKHLTLSRSDGGPDATFSIEPTEMASLVETIRRVEQTIGTVSYRVTKAEKENIRFKRSLFVVKAVKKGERFSQKNVRSIRPGFGLPPEYLKTIIGKRAVKAVAAGTPLRWNMVQL